jgi:hypothetical protein
MLQDSAMTLLSLLLLIAASSVAGAPLDLSAVPTQACSAILEDGSLLDCEDEQSVTMELLMVLSDDPLACEQDSRNCPQTFIVRCDDFWSHQHGTEHAILINEAAAPHERLTQEQLPGRGLPVTLRVRRDIHCDQTPYEGGWGSDCVAWDCLPECCRIFSGFVDFNDGSEVLLEDLERFGSLPCLRLEHDRSPQEARDFTPAKSGYEDPPLGPQQ